MRIQHNIAAMSSYRNYNRNTSAVNKNLEKLSSGYKINRAGDDAAGLAISEKMRAQITGLNAAQKNVKDGISLVKTAEGAMQEVQDMLNRMTYLATQSANGTYDDTVDRKALQDEVNELLDEIDRIADSANFNGIKLLDGSLSKETSGIVTENFTAGTAAGTTMATVTASNSPFAWGSNTTTASVPTASKVLLHADAPKGQIGSFTIDLKDMAVEVADSTTVASLKLTFSYTTASGASKTATATLTAASSAAGSGLTTSDIASLLADKALVISASGTVSFAEGTASVAAGALVYKGVQGTNANANKVTFTAHAIAAGSSATASGILNASATLKASNAQTSTKALSSKQCINLDFGIVAVSNSAGTVTGIQHVGVDQWTKTQAAGNPQFGQAVLTLDPTKIKDNMTVEIAGKEFTIKTTGTVASSATGVIDLTKFADASGAIASSKVTEVAQAIANAFKSVDTKGVEVGAKNGNITLSERVSATGTSEADASVQEAMKTLNGFKSLVVFKEQTATAETTAQDVLTVDTNKFFEGDALEITNGSVTTKYVFTNASSVASGVKVALGSTVDKTVANLKAAIGSSSTVTFAAATDGNGKATGKVTITYTLPASATAGTVTSKVTGKDGMYLQIGDTSDDYNRLNVEIKDMHADALGVGELKINTAETAKAAIQTIKDAINSVSSVRGTLGAKQNRLEHTANNLSVMAENIQDAESTIRDTDIAEEMMAYTKNNILVQSAQAMLAQANQIPQGVLQLLG